MEKEGGCVTSEHASILLTTILERYVQLRDVTLCIATTGANEQ